MEKAPKNLHIVIPAGGFGTRLWPKSKKSFPKQFISLYNGKSVIQTAVSRLEGFIPYERIFIVAHDIYRQHVFSQLPKFIPENFISEPEIRGTSAAVGLGALFVRKRNPQAVIHFLVCDDYIEDLPRFRRMISAAADWAQRKKVLVVYGVKPAHPAIRYGYIKAAAYLGSRLGIPFYEVRAFFEKPELKTAEKYLKEGGYFWHGSGFTFQAELLLEEMRKKWSAGYRCLKMIDRAFSLPADLEKKRIAGIYRKIEEIPIEKSILEKAEKIVMAELESTWRDIGNWSVLYEISRKDQDGNVVVKEGNRGSFIGLDTKNNFIQLDGKQIAAIGIENMIIVQAGEIIMICPRERAEDVKKIVESLKKMGKMEYL